MAIRPPLAWTRLFLIFSPSCCGLPLMAKNTPSDVRARLGFELALTQLKQDELLPSGRQSRFANRVAWAKVYLERGGLLESPQRGRLVISTRGREVLSARPARIDIKLRSSRSFVEFQEAKRQDRRTIHLVDRARGRSRRDARGGAGGSARQDRGQSRL